MHFSGTAVRYRSLSRADYPRPQKTDRREKATDPHEAERCTGLPKGKSVLPAPVFPSFPNKKSPAFGEPPGTFKERENQLVVFCMK